MKKTLVIGASLKPERVSYLAVIRLTKAGHPVIAYGIKPGNIGNTHIENHFEELDTSEIDTITLYINPQIQKEFYERIVQIKPKRIIFNPGTENQELKRMAEEEGITCEFACTLVLLSLGSY